MTDCEVGISSAAPPLLHARIEKDVIVDLRIVKFNQYSRTPDSRTVSVEQSCPFHQYQSCLLLQLLWYS